MINKNTKIFLSISATPGNFGATVYNSIFAERGIDAVYLPRKAPGNLEVLVNALKELEISGCSISMPYKSQILELLDEIHEDAKALNAVNTVVNRDGRLFGYNSDIDGIRTCLKNLNISRALIYGTGAMACVTAHVLKELSAEEIFLAGRNEEKVSAIATAYGLVQHSIQRSKSSFDVVINATPAGKVEDGSELFTVLDSTKAIFDMSVQTKPTAWVSAAHNRELTTLDGTDLYVSQVCSQCALYTSFRPEEQEVRKLVASLG